MSGVSVAARAMLALAVCGLGASCFDGAGALGLPCRSDGDCGQGQRCEQGFCGGPPATTGEPTSSTSMSTSTESSSGESSSSSTTVESTGPLPTCGDGVLDSGEECDPGPSGDAADCNYDCTAVLCGDGYANLVAGEECDDGNGALLDDCTPQCRNTLFWDDMGRNPMFTGNWLEPEIPEWVSEVDGSTFLLMDGWRWDESFRFWNSGFYSSTSGTARITTRPIEFPPDPGPGFRYEVWLRHRLLFDNSPDDMCTRFPETADGGVVWLWDGKMRRQASPLPGHPETLDNPGSCSSSPTMPEPNNPLYDPAEPRPVYSGNTLDFVEIQFPLPPDVAGTTQSLVFEVSYDCANCWMDNPPNGAGWTIDEIVVAAMPE